jgi:hypothetical protein
MLIMSRRGLVIFTNYHDPAAHASSVSLHSVIGPKAGAQQGEVTRAEVAEIRGAPYET